MPAFEYNRPNLQRRTVKKSGPPRMVRAVGADFYGDRDYYARLGGGVVGGFYIPDPDEILSVATPGNFYRPTSTETIYGISKRAYGTATPGIYRINDSDWNSYIRKGSKGWTAYGIVGVQLDNAYSNNPLRSAYNSGKSRPILWIPPFDSSEPVTPDEPEPEPPDDEPGIPFIGPYIPSGPAPDTTPPKLKPKKKKKKKRKTIPFDPPPKKKKKKRKTVPFDPPPKKKKKKKKTVPSRPPEVPPKKKKKKRPPAKIKIVPVQVPIPIRVPVRVPVKEKRNKLGNLGVGLLLFGAFVVVSETAGE